MVSDIRESPRNTVLMTAYDKDLCLHLKNNNLSNY